VKLKNNETFGVRLSWQLLSQTLSLFQIEGESCARAAALQNFFFNMSATFWTVQTFTVVSAELKRHFLYNEGIIFRPLGD
jgi:hypothetical protein